MTTQVNFRLSNPVHFLALGFGSGLLRPAPGTWGTLAAIPVYLLLTQLTLPLFIAAVVVSFALGVYLCGKTASDVDVHDHPAIVWDEFVGYFVAMLAIPPTLPNIVLGFALFRLFDIWKPWPIRVLDKSVHGGFGIMIDDVLAGAYACVLLHLAQPYI